MKLDEDGMMIILSSPSGAGKTTLTKLISEKKKYNISISHTTRKPRPSEINEKDYFFIKKQEFDELIKNDEFLEYAKVFDNFYGTRKTQVLKSLKEGKNILFDIDWQGAKQIKEKKLNYKLITFFVLPPSKKELLERLTNREKKDKIIIEERMKHFEKDILHWKDYDYVVINDNLDKCFNEINNLIDSKINKTKNEYDKNKIVKHIKLLSI